MSHPDTPIFDSAIIPVDGVTTKGIANDGTYTPVGDAYDNTVVKVEPAAGQLTQGLRPGKQIGAQHFNWIMGQVGAILGALIAHDDAHEITLASHTEDLADHEARVTELEDHSPRIRVYEFLRSGGASQSFVVPPRCVALLAIGCGGGGGGGSADDLDPESGTSRNMPGGGGGGGAQLSVQPIFGRTPGQTLTIVPGSPGTGGPTMGSWGLDGGDSLVLDGATPLATFVGAAGGRGITNQNFYVGVDELVFMPGGCALRDTPTVTMTAANYHYMNSNVVIGRTHQQLGLVIQAQLGQGGFGHGGASHSATAGSLNPVGGHAAGIAGLWGDAAPDPTQWGGGGGGGGAAGPFGAGGDGGNGQQGAAPGRQCKGGDAALDSGGGGGGGGAGGYLPANGSYGPFGMIASTSLGGNGGGGRVYIITVEESP